uniref:Uncharacterized protein n=1 Tax=Plectus sambesii TaxID=2011161 RepID=A0A914WG90_9BILA
MRLVAVCCLLGVAAQDALAVISWGPARKTKDEPWFFQANGGRTTPRHRNRHSGHRSRANGCQEPNDLSEQFMTWFKESTVNTDHQLDIADEDWQRVNSMDALRVEEPPICDRLPDTSADSTVMQRSLCPWEWRINRDENREPKLLSEAFCICRKSRGSTGALCMPIRREMPVLKRVLCDERTGRYEYVRAVQIVTVGCHSVLPRSERAAPVHVHYRTASREV